MSEASCRLYAELASWWPLLSAPEEYAEEAGIYLEALRSRCRRPPRSLLELGSGGGNNASHLKAHFDEVVLVDLSEEMLEVSRGLNPECEHRRGDMRSVRLGRLFDCVFVHDAVCYMTSEEDLRAAMATARAHCAPGGAALFAPDFTRETFREHVDDGGHDGEDGRGLRYLAWATDPDPADSVYRVDFAYLLRDADGTVRAVHDRHDEGLFSRDQWLAWLRKSGFEPEALPFEHSDLAPEVTEIFVAGPPDDGAS